MDQMISRHQLESHLAQVLDITQVRDYCPNGLQVEGRDPILKIATGVTASMATIEAAIKVGADALLVHHGYFWRNEDPRIVGQKGRRIRLLMQHELSLFAYHLPLDMHPDLGNNSQLGKLLGLTPTSRFGEHQLGWLGEMADPGVRTVGDLANVLTARLRRAPLVIGDLSKEVHKIGWCTGAAQGMLGDALAAGADAYISGEISESAVHLAREEGIAYFSAGHHATERYGIQALGEYLANEFSIAHEFIDIDNPV